MDYVTQFASPKTQSRCKCAFAAQRSSRSAPSGQTLQPFSLFFSEPVLNNKLKFSLLARMSVCRGERHEKFMKRNFPAQLEKQIFLTKQRYLSAGSQRRRLMSDERSKVSRNSLSRINLAKARTFFPRKHLHPCNYIPKPFSCPSIMVSLHELAINPRSNVLF